MADLELDQRTTHPPNPSSGETIIYPHSDGNVYARNPTGPPVNLSAMAVSAGSNLTFQNTFPSSPSMNDVNIFSAAVASGLDWRDSDGTTVLNSAADGDIAKFNGTNWIKQANIKNLFTLNAGDIPDLPASRITSEVFNIDRIPDIPTSKVTGYVTPKRFSDDIQVNLRQISPSLTLSRADHNGRYIECEVIGITEGLINVPSASTLGDGFYCRIEKVDQSGNTLNVQGILLNEQTSWVDIEVAGGVVTQTPVYNSQTDWNLPSTSSNRNAIRNKPSNVVIGLSLNGNNLEVTRQNPNTNQTLAILASIPVDTIRGQHRNLGSPVSNAPNIIRGNAIDLQSLYTAGLGQQSDYNLVAGTISVSSDRVILSKNTSTNAEFDRFIDISGVPIGTTVILSITAETGGQTQSGRLEARMAPASGTGGSSPIIGHSVNGGAQTYSFSLIRTNANHTRLWIKGTAVTAVGSRLEITAINIATNPSYPAGSAFASQGFSDITVPAAEGSGNVSSRFIFADNGAFAIKAGAGNWVERGPEQTAAQIATSLNALTGNSRLDAGSLRGTLSIDRLPFQPRQSTILFSNTTLPAVDHERLVRSIAVSDVTVNLEQTILPNGFYARFIVEGNGSVTFRSTNNGALNTTIPTRTLRTGQVGILTVTNPGGAPLSFNLTILNTDFRYFTVQDLPAPAVLGLHQDAGTVVSNGPSFINGEQVARSLYDADIGNLNDWDGSTDSSWQTTITSGVLQVTRTQQAGGHPTVARFFDISRIPLGTAITVTFEAQVGAAGQTGNVQFFIVQSGNSNPQETPQQLNVTSTTYGSHSFTFTRTNATNHARILLQFLVTSNSPSTLRVRNLSITTNPAFTANDHLASQGFIDLNANARPGTNIMGQSNVGSRRVIADDGSVGVRAAGASTWIEDRGPINEFIYNPSTPPTTGPTTINLDAGKRFSDYEQLEFRFRPSGLGDSNGLFRMVSVTSFETIGVAERVSFAILSGSGYQPRVIEGIVSHTSDTAALLTFASGGASGSVSLALVSIRGARF